MAPEDNFKRILEHQSLRFFRTHIQMSICCIDTRRVVFMIIFLIFSRRVIMFLLPLRIKTRVLGVKISKESLT